MPHESHGLTQNIASRARELGLSPQQELIVQLIVSEHLSIKTVADRLNTSPANIHNQIAKIKRKAGAAAKKREIAALAQQARRKFADLAGCVLFMHSRGIANKLIAEALGIEKRRVADILYRNKGKRYIVSSIVPASDVPKDSPAFRAAHEDAWRTYYRAFVAGGLSPNSKDGRDLLRSLVLAGAGGWQAKKVVLSDKANMLRLLAERGRADRTGTPILHVDSDDETGKHLSPVLERYFRRIGPHSWKPVSDSAWAAVREAAASSEGGTLNGGGKTGCECSHY